MRVERAPASDVLLRDGQTAVLVDGSLELLGELSSAIYALCERPTNVSALARELESAFGSPAGRTVLAATEEAITELVTHRLLVTGT